MSSYHDAPVGTSDTGMVPSGTLAPVSALPVGIAVTVFGLLVDTSGVGYVPLGVVGALLDTAYSMLDEVTVLEVLYIKVRVRSTISITVFYETSVLM
jgi:hypothetical protein